MKLIKRILEFLSKLTIRCKSSCCESECISGNSISSSSNIKGDSSGVVEALE